jgi:hypothetical protein
MTSQVIGYILIAFCGFSILADARNWTWWTDNIYSNNMREEWGEVATKIYTWFFCGLGIIFGSFVILGIDPFEKLATKTVIFESQINVTDSQGSYNYRLENQSRTLKVTETSFLSKMPRNAHGGLTAELRYFDDSATRKFEKKYKNARTCPASFFNRHTQRKFLFTGSPEVRAELKSWENQTWKNTDEWYLLTLAGRCIEGANSYVLNDKEMVERLSKGTFANCSHFYVESIKSRMHYDAAKQTL